MEGIKKIIKYFILGMILILLQGLWKSTISFLPVPNLLLILVVYTGVREISVLCAFLAFMLGLELDLYLGVVLGPWAGAYVFVYGVLSLLSRRIFIDSGVVIFITVFILSMLSSFIYVALAFDFQPLKIIEYFSISAGEALVTAFVSPLLFKLFFRLKPESPSFWPFGQESV